MPHEHLLQPRGVDVLAVRDLVAAVGGGDRGEHLGVDAGVVVGGEAADGGVVELIGHRTILPSGASAAEPAIGGTDPGGVPIGETRRR